MPASPLAGGLLALAAASFLVFLGIIMIVIGQEFGLVGPPSDPTRFDRNASWITRLSLGLAVVFGIAAFVVTRL